MPDEDPSNLLNGGEGWRNRPERRKEERRQTERRAIPEGADDLARAAQATHISIMALAAAQDKLESVRADRKADPTVISDAATLYRKCEAQVSRCVGLEVQAHRKMLKEALTPPQVSVKINASKQDHP